MKRNLFLIQCMINMLCIISVPMCVRVITMRQQISGFVVVISNTKRPVTRNPQHGEKFQCFPRPLGSYSVSHACVRECVRACVHACMHILHTYIACMHACITYKFNSKYIRNLLLIIFVITAQFTLKTCQVKSTC